MQKKLTLIDHKTLRMLKDLHKQTSDLNPVERIKLADRVYIVHKDGHFLVTKADTVLFVGELGDTTPTYDRMPRKLYDWEQVPGTSFIKIIQNEND